jgi:hypothetical protein
MSIFGELDWPQIKSHYDQRSKESKNLRNLFEAKNVSEFVLLALGMTSPTGNYSAAEHGLGPKVLESNPSPQRPIFNLAGRFVRLKDASAVPELIRKANLQYLRI